MCSVFKSSLAIEYYKDNNSDISKAICNDK